MRKKINLDLQTGPINKSIWYYKPYLILDITEDDLVTKPYLILDITYDLGYILVDREDVLTLINYDVRMSLIYGYMITTLIKSILFNTSLKSNVFRTNIPYYISYTFFVNTIPRYTNAVLLSNNPKLINNLPLNITRLYINEENRNNTLSNEKIIIPSRITP